MPEQSTQYTKVNLFPGEAFIAEKPSIIWTLLGSCLAIILHNKQHQFGAIAHAQLAQDSRIDHLCYAHCPNPCFSDLARENPFTYVSCSIRHLVEEFTSRGITPTEIDVKIFGGASLMRTPQTQEGRTVGEMNIKAANRLIADYGLTLRSKQLGGNTGRTLYFYSDTGEVYLRRHRSRKYESDEYGEKPSKPTELSLVSRV